MNPYVIEVDSEALMKLISSAPGVSLEENESKIMRECAGMSMNLYAGFADEQFVCAYGLIPPSFLSEQAYIWLYATPALEENKFVFLRHSQRIVEEMLKLYPRLIGFCSRGNVKAIRWIKWLGGKFAEPEGDRVNFVIRQSHG